MKHEGYAGPAMSRNLAKLGFDWNCRCYWSKENAPEGQAWFITHFNPKGFNNIIDGTELKVGAPTLSVVGKWLRETKHISVRVNYLAHNKTWFYDVLNMEDLSYFQDDDEYNTYEEALTAGIKEVIDILNAEKQQ